MLDSLYGLTSLNHEVELIVCTKDRNDKELPKADVTQAVDHVSRFFGKRFGGFTVIEARGGWVLPDNSLSVEKNFLVQASVSDEDFNDKNMAIILTLADEIKLMLQQDAVSLKVDGKRYFV